MCLCLFDIIFLPFPTESSRYICIIHNDMVFSCTLWQQFAQSEEGCVCCIGILYTIRSSRHNVRCRNSKKFKCKLKSSPYQRIFMTNIFLDQKNRKSRSEKLTNKYFTLGKINNILFTSILCSILCKRIWLCKLNNSCSPE